MVLGFTASSFYIFDVEACKKAPIHFVRKNRRLFVIFSEKKLDKWNKGWYYY